MVQIYLEPVIYKELKRYAFENEITVSKLIKPLTEDFQNSIKKLVEELKITNQEPPKVES